MAKRKMKTQAVGYCRVSSVGQQTNGTGLDRQKEVITGYAKRAGYEIIHVYQEAFTGTETDRPVFDDMLTDLLGDGCRVIICERLDRIARDLAVQMQIIALLTNKGITLLDASTQQNVTESMEADPMMRAMVQIQGTFAELDKRLLVKKLKKGRQAKLAKTGHCEGRKPFGFYPGEAETIKRMKQLHRKPRGGERLGPYQIARILNGEGCKTRKAIQWRGSQVSAILNRLKMVK